MEHVISDQILKKHAKILFEKRTNLHNPYSLTQNSYLAEQIIHLVHLHHMEAFVFKLQNTYHNRGKKKPNANTNQLVPVHIHCQVHNRTQSWTAKKHDKYTFVHLSHYKKYYSTVRDVTIKWNRNIITSSNVIYLLPQNLGQYLSIIINHLSLCNNSNPQLVHSNKPVFGTPHRKQQITSNL